MNKTQFIESNASLHITGYISMINVDMRNHMNRSMKKETGIYLGVRGRDFLYRRMESEARGDLFVKATCLENSDQSLTLFLTE